MPRVNVLIKKIKKNKKKFKKNKIKKIIKIIKNYTHDVHVCIDWVKIGLGAQNCKRANIGGSKVVIFLGGQNRNFWILRGLKL